MILMRIKLIDGMSSEVHENINIADTVGIFEEAVFSYGGGRRSNLDKQSLYFQKNFERLSYSFILEDVNSRVGISKAGMLTRTLDHFLRAFLMVLFDGNYGASNSHFVPSIAALYRKKMFERPL